MTPDPPSPSPDGPMLPPRHRPTLENITKDSTELDLWAFEDDLEMTEPPVKPLRTATSRASGGELPAPRERHVVKQREASQPLDNSSPAGGERIQMNVGKARQRSMPSVETVRILKPESDFDDLENWHDVPKEPQLEELPEESHLEKPAEPEPLQAEPETAVLGQPDQPEEPEEPVAEPAVPQEADDNEFAPSKRSDAAPVSLRPQMKLSTLERIGLLVLLAVLAFGGLATLVFSIKRLPTESARADAADFPIKGSRMTIESAESYWREPITDGPSPEIIRRGTKLLPVIELKVSEGSGAIRVLFRNEERAVQGDAVTRTVQGPGMLVIPATAGFDDLGMHAAYRTGGSKPWTIEIYEAPTENASGKDFKKLFEINISTDRR